MKNKFVITNYKEKLLCAVYEDDRPVELIFSEETDFPVGSIYLGRVNSIVKNLNAAFVDIGGRTMGYLPLNTDEKIKIGSDILVKIEKDAIKSKKVRLSRDISIGGKYVAVSKGRPGIGISKKIVSEEKRESLKKNLLEMIGNDQKLNRFFNEDDHGLVIRTAASDADSGQIRYELDFIVDKFEKSVDFAENRTSYSCLYMPPEEFLTRIRDSKGDIERIVTDIPEIYEKIKEYFFDDRELLNSTALYSDEMLPLIKLYSLETVIDEALQKKVWLKSGGYLVIEPTEALTVIDVNSGKNIKNKNKQDLILEINLEAVRESCRQMRLRNISGIIIIDFINMRSSGNISKLTEEIKKVTRKDRIRTQFVDITPLGLAEITREKVHKSLKENLYNFFIDERQKL